jgi:predicted GIY-YIG superfamily endonuclease
LSEFQYVYILVTVNKPTRHYVGRTTDLENRLKQHNHGQVPHTAKHRPWRIETAISFRSEAKAIAFQRYLKPASEHEFARRHF